MSQRNKKIHHHVKYQDIDIPIFSSTSYLSMLSDDMMCNHQNETWAAAVNEKRREDVDPCANKQTKKKEFDNEAADEG